MSKKSAKKKRIARLRQATLPEAPKLVLENPS